MSASPSLIALRQALRAVNRKAAITHPGRGIQLQSSRALHRSATMHEQMPASTSAAPTTSFNTNVPDAADGSDTPQDLSDLHSQFEIDGDLYEMPPIDEGTNLVAVPNRSSLVHVPLTRLRKPPVASTEERVSRQEKLFVPLSAHVFDAPARRDVIHSAVVWYLDSLRAGTANTKTRSEVRGSMRKLRPQKGSGRARLGTMSSPSLRGGAVAHGPKPRDHSTELPRRVRELALRSMLSSKWRQGELLVLPVLEWMPPPSSTGPLSRLLKTKGWDDALFLTAPRKPRQSERSTVREVRPSSSDPVYDQAQRDSHHELIKNFIIASKNIPRIEVIQLDKLTETYVDKVAKTSAEKKRPGELHTYQILRRKKLICDLGAIEWLEEKLGGAIYHEAGSEHLAEEEQWLSDTEPPAGADVPEATIPSSAQAETATRGSTSTLTAEEEKARAELLTKQQAQAEASIQ